MMHAPWLMIAMVCAEVWPNNMVGVNRAPSNPILWAPDQGDTHTIEGTISDGGAGTIHFDAQDELMPINGGTWRAHAPREAVENLCVRFNNGMDSLCFGDILDDEAPIDPVLNAEISLPRYGVTNNGVRRTSGNCDGVQNPSGNLKITIEADENSPLLVHVVVKNADTVLHDFALPMQGRYDLRLDVGEVPQVSIEARFIDQAGQLGELATLTVQAPPMGCQGCSHSGLGWLGLMALAGLRRRRR